MTVPADSVVLLVERMRDGDEVAREDLARRIHDRMTKLARRMMRESPRAVQRWEQTDDLVQSAWFRIERLLRDESIQPNDTAHLLRLSARHIRFELIDIYRKHTGANGIEAHHHSVGLQKDAERGQGEFDPAADHSDVSSLADWEQLHAEIDSLPEREREVTELIWYQGMTQQEVAEVLGVNARTVRRAWRNARLQLAKSLDLLRD